MKELVLNVLDLILKSYRDVHEAATNPTSSDDALGEKNRSIVTQNQALQILFDLKFLFTLFDVKSIANSSTTASPSSSLSDNDDSMSIGQMASKLNESFKNVTALYESMVDPFDYDICMPFIQSNVVKCIARSSVRLDSNPI